MMQLIGYPVNGYHRSVCGSPRASPVAACSSHLPGLGESRPSVFGPLWIILNSDAIDSGCSSVHGGCHCGNISYVAEFTNEPSAYTPRACDCRLCTSHGASYASDRNGTLIINIKNKYDVSKYRQGSQVAGFLICKICGIMTGACYEENGCIYGSINVRSTNEFAAFSESKIARLAILSDEERINRWKEYWFANVLIKYENA